MKYLDTPEFAQTYFITEFRAELRGAMFADHIQPQRASYTELDVVREVFAFHQKIGRSVNRTYEEFIYDHMVFLGRVVALCSLYDIRSIWGKCLKKYNTSLHDLFLFLFDNKDLGIIEWENKFGDLNKLLQQFVVSE